MVFHLHCTVGWLFFELTNLGKFLELKMYTVVYWLSCHLVFVAISMLDCVISFPGQEMHTCQKLNILLPSLLLIPDAGLVI